MSLNKAQVERIIKERYRLSNRRVKDDCMPIGVKQTGTIVDSRHALAKVFRDSGFKRGAEIGVNDGRYSRMLCETIPDLEYYGVDIWLKPHRKRRAKKRVRPFNATLIQKTSMEALNDFEDESLDFVYIDADHSYNHVAPDIIFWSKKVRQHGIVSGHDYYCFRHSGVVEAVNSYTHCNCISPWFVTKDPEPSWFWVNP